MEVTYSTKRNITPDKAVEILAKYGRKVTIEEAKIILDLMYKIGKLSVDQYVKI